MSKLDKLLNYLTEQLGWSLVGGNAQNSSASGSDNHDIFRMYQGNDTVYPNGGNDLLVLGAGRDTIIFDTSTTAGNYSLDQGDDILFDYQPGVDRFDFSEYPTTHSLADITVTSQSNGILVEYGNEEGGGSLLLFHAHAINFDDFIF